MKAALLYDKEDLRVVEIDRPKVGSGDILVKVKACAVCPTDIRKYRTGDHGVPKFPINLGHEWTGDVVETGEKIEAVTRGMRVIGFGYTGYAEYAKMAPVGKIKISWDPSTLQLPDNVSYEEGTFAEPLADCLHSIVDQAKVRVGDFVAVIGAGQMGLQHLMVAKTAGAKVIVIELLEKRLNFAEKLGADCVIDASRENPVDEVMRITGGEGADSVIVSISSQETITQALKMAKKRGRVVLFGGTPKGSIVQVDPNVIHYNEIEVTGSSWVGTFPHYDIKLYCLALDLISSNKIPVSRLITHRFPLEAIHRAFEVIESKRGLKAIIVP